MNTLKRFIRLIFVLTFLITACEKEQITFEKTAGDKVKTDHTHNQGAGSGGG